MRENGENTLLDDFAWYVGHITPHTRLAVRRGELGYADCDQIDAMADRIVARIKALEANPLNKMSDAEIIGLLEDAGHVS